MLTQNRFLQGVFPFEGVGLDKPAPLADELVTVVLLRDGVPMRYFPIGAKGDVHVPLRVVEDLPGGTVVELHAAAPEGVTGELVVDLGLVEV